MAGDRAAPGPVADAAGIVAGFALDALLGDPRRFHPVAGFGTVAIRCWREPSRRR
jgi:adenosylcobinamide-phosphate synthase